MGGNGITENPPSEHITSIIRPSYLLNNKGIYPQLNNYTRNLWRVLNDSNLSPFIKGNSLVFTVVVGGNKVCPFGQTLYINMLNN